MACFLLKLSQRSTLSDNIFDRKFCYHIMSRRLDFDFELRRFRCLVGYQATDGQWWAIPPPGSAQVGRKRKRFSVYVDRADELRCARDVSNRQLDKAWHTIATNVECPSPPRTLRVRLAGSSPRVVDDLRTTWDEVEEAGRWPWNDGKLFAGARGNGGRNRSECGDVLFVKEGWVSSGSAVSAVDGCPRHLHGFIVDSGEEMEEMEDPQLEGISHHFNLRRCGVRRRTRELR